MAVIVWATNVRLSLAPLKRAFHTQKKNYCLYKECCVAWIIELFLFDDGGVGRVMLITVRMA